MTTTRAWAEPAAAARCAALPLGLGRECICIRTGTPTTALAGLNGNPRLGIQPKQNSAKLKVSLSPEGNCYVHATNLGIDAAID